VVFMDITPFVESLRQDLLHAAEAGGADVRAAAERLSHALDPAVRLTLMDALSQAASEVTHELAGTSVEVRLKGREPIFVVIGAATEPPAVPGSPPGGDDTDEDTESGFEGEDEPVARITLRLPESLKARAEELANKRGQSLNTWLVNAARAAASFNIDVSSTPFGPGAPGRNRSSNKRIQGWVR
jgi:hypothetical protein